MIEITLGENLVRCKRYTYPLLHPLIDIFTDLPLARQLIIAAERFFAPTANCVYSGYARKCDELLSGYFFAQLWHRGRVHRTVAFKDLGYVGVLHLELPDGPDDVKELFDIDIIGDLCKGRAENLAEFCVGYVGNHRLEISVPYTSFH